MPEKSLFNNQNLIAYMDETGDSKGEDYFGMGGLIATAAQWELLTIEWNKILKEYGLTYFHMVEFAHSKKQFKPFKNDERQRKLLLGRLMGTIIHMNPVPFASMVIIKDFKELPVTEQESYHSFYDMVFQDSISLASYVADDEHSNQYSQSGAPIELVFAARPGITHRATYVFNRLKNEGRYRGRLSSLRIEDARQVPPLQSADVLAYEVHKNYSYIKPNQKPLRFAYREFNRMAVQHKEYVWNSKLDKNHFDMIRQSRSRSSTA